jgi:hypothetical protein
MSSNNFTHDTVMTTICIYEYIQKQILAVGNKVSKSEEEHLIESFWNTQSEYGAYELRQTAIDLAPHFDEAFKVFGDDGFQDAFDWHYIPDMLNAAVLKDSDAFLSWDTEQWVNLTREVYSEKLDELVEAE